MQGSSHLALVKSNGRIESCYFNASDNFALAQWRPAACTDHFVMSSPKDRDEAEPASVPHFHIGGDIVAVGT
jgi:hypothetical protein